MGNIHAVIYRRVDAPARSVASNVLVLLNPQEASVVTNQVRKVENHIMKQRILFLCTGNSARSQIAEALLRQLAGDRFESFSAGTHPVGLNPGAVAAMKEVDIDISGQRSKSMIEFLGQPFDYVITVCDRAKESCPNWPQASKVMHWSFEDPAAAIGSAQDRRQAFREVRDQIADRISEFLCEDKHSSQ